MKVIDILMEEHQRILRFCDGFENLCLKTMECMEVDYQGFRDGITFIREFADHTHHKKEEDILFKYMMNELGGPAIKLIQNGMLVEHDLARHEVKLLEEALNEHEQSPNGRSCLYIITHAMSYCLLLRRHIEKEDKVAYPFAVRELSQEHFEQMEQEMFGE